MATLKLVREQRHTQTKTDTIQLTREVVEKWKAPPFQRPIRANGKVIALADVLKENGGVLPGMLTIGVFKGEEYIVDGQHRLEAFKLSALDEAYTDVRFRNYSAMADMAEDFVQLNSVLVRMRPDDILRGLEGSLPPLQLIRTRCPFVGYDQIRRGTSSPIVSMSMLLRVWRGSSVDTPVAHNTSATDLAQTLTQEEAEKAADFLTLAMRAWGKDPEYQRLWGALNIVLCMWLYRRTVIAGYSQRSVRMNKEQFAKCLMSLSADSRYLEWLVGRNLGERDRNPAYQNIRAIFVARIQQDTGKKVAFPSPEWAHS